MYSYISGRVAEISNNQVVLDVNGIGYGIFVTAKTLRSSKIGDNAKIYTFLNVKEDEMSLYGFYDAAEKAMFLHLISISGVGPKLALSILSGVETKELAGAIVAGNHILLSKIKGVGKKTSERIIVELKDKLAKIYTAEGEVEQAAESVGDLEEAVMYLMAMGLTKAEAVRKIKAVFVPGMSVEETVVAALSVK